RRNRPHAGAARRDRRRGRAARGGDRALPRARHRARRLPRAADRRQRVRAPAGGEVRDPVRGAARLRPRGVAVAHGAGRHRGVRRPRYPAREREEVARPAARAAAEGGQGRGHPQDRGAAAPPDRGDRAHGGPREVPGRPGGDGEPAGEVRGAARRADRAADEAEPVRLDQRRRRRTRAGGLLMRARPWLLAALAFASCRSSMTLPKDFLQLQDASDYQALTVDEARVWVRTFRDPDEGELEFWAKTLQHDLVEQRGYEPTGSGDAKDASGRAGRWFEFRTHVDGERVGYLIAVFVLPKKVPLFSSQHVCTVEYTAREAVFVTRLDAVRAALATLSP